MDPKADLLTQLQDIDLPEHSGWWIAPGWFLLAALLVLLCWYGYGRWKKYRHHQKTNWRPEALAEVQQLRTEIDAGQFGDVLTGASRLARRVALAMSGREDVAVLTGERWLQKLDDLSETKAFTKGAGRLLATAPYRPDGVTDESLLRDIVDAVEVLILPSSSRVDSKVGALGPARKTESGSTLSESTSNRKREA